jgi:Protein of unknown function (DUF2889)
MPLSAPAPRELLHTRQIECQGFHRNDGLWDIEAHMIDRKSYSFPSDERGEVVAGTPIHDMWVRVTLDDSFLIQAIEAVTDASPYQLCPAITPNFQRLVGLRIGPGFNRKVKELVGGVEGCTHLVELMGPLATTAFQTIFSAKHREQRERAQGSEGVPARPSKRPRLIDTCHALASDSPVTKRTWPEFYTGS